MTPASDGTSKSCDSSRSPSTTATARTSDPAAAPENTARPFSSVVTVSERPPPSTNCTGWPAMAFARPPRTSRTVTVPAGASVVGRGIPDIARGSGIPEPPMPPIWAKALDDPPASARATASTTAPAAPAPFRDTSPAGCRAASSFSIRSRYTRCPWSSCRISRTARARRRRRHLLVVGLRHLAHRPVEIELLDRAKGQRLLALEGPARPAAQQLGGFVPLPVRQRPEGPVQQVRRPPGAEHRQADEDDVRGSRPAHGQRGGRCRQQRPDQEQVPRLEAVDAVVAVRLSRGLGVHRPGAAPVRGLPPGRPRGRRGPPPRVAATTSSPPRQPG